MLFFIPSLQKVGRYLFLALAVIAHTSLLAQVTQYQGPSGGSWFDAANWSAGLPVAGVEAQILNGNMVLIDQNLTADFVISSFGTITVDEGVTATFNENILSPNFVNNGTVVNNQTMNIQSVFTNTGSVQNTGTMTLQSASTSSGSFTNSGTMNLFNSFGNSGAFTTTGIVNNNNAWTNTGAATFSVPTGGQFINDFGSSFLLSAGMTATIQGSFLNAGTLNNNGTFDVTGLVRNTITVNCTAGSALLLKPNSQYQNFGTSNFSGSSSISPTATLQIAAFSTVNNLGTLTNNGNIELTGTFDNNATGTFLNPVGGILSGQFGSSIINSNVFTNNGILNSNGVISNLAGTMTNTGAITAGVGATLTNDATFVNSGNLTHVSQVTNNGTMTNTGQVQIQSGGLFTNAGDLTNSITGTFAVQFELLNNGLGTFTNNGKVNVEVRLLNDGLFVNNAYLLANGIISNSGTLDNYDLFELASGAFDNSGTINNYNNWQISACSEVQNRTSGIINNLAVVTNKGIIIQRGTLSGNPINSALGFVHTGATSDAPICNEVTIGTTALGEAKAYAQGFVSILAIDSCANFVYLANGLPRPVFNCDQLGPQPISLVVRTPTGDSLTCSTIAHVIDNLAPEFTGCPTNQYIQTVDTTATASWTAPSIIDNCDATPTLSLDKPSGSSFKLGVTGVTYTATDDAGNLNFCQFKITVQQVAGPSNCTNSAAPTFSNCPANITMVQSALGGNTAVFWANPTAVNACYPLNVSSNYESGALFPVGEHTVTYTAVNGNNQSANCSFTVTITAVNPCTNDTQKPTFTGCPTNIYLPGNPNTNTAVVNWTPPSVGDNCPTNLSVTSNLQPGIIFPVGSTTVTYTAVDAAGNSAVCVFSIIVGPDPCAGDVTGPVFSNCPSNVSVSTSNLTATANWTAPTATDNCGGVSINSNVQPGASFPVGTSTVTYTASDAKGNVSTCSFTVSINNACVGEIVAPEISNCPASQNVVSTYPSLSTAVTWSAPTATDNCSTVTFTSTHQPGSNFSVGVTTVTYAAVDQSGNISNCTFFVSVTAGLPDVCATPRTVTNNTEGASCPDYVGPTYGMYFNDIWPGLGQEGKYLTLSNASFNENSNGTATLTALATSNANANIQFLVNVSFCGRTFTPPPSSPKLPSCYTADSAPWYYYASMCGTLTGQNLAAGALIYITPKETAFQVGVGANLNEADSFGASAWFNTQILSNPTSGGIVLDGTNGGDFNFNLSGTPAPNTCTGTSVCAPCVAPPSVVTINCPASQTITTASSTGTIVNYTLPTASTTNCVGAVTVSKVSGLSSGAVFPIGVSTVVYSATNACGVSATCSFTVTVNQQVAGNGQSIGNFIFNDLDLDGIQDAGEPGVEYVSISLFKSTGQWVAWAGSGPNGEYNFSSTTTPNLVPGQYKVCITPPWNLPNATLKGAGTSGDLDSDVNPVTSGAACTDIITVDANQQISNIDAGFTSGVVQPSCSITSAVSNIQCSNNGTATVASDDTYTFSVTVLSNGSCTGTWTSGTQTGSYGTPTTFGPYPISGGNKTLTFTSATGQTTSITATAPATCSNGTTTLSISCPANISVNATSSNGAIVTFSSASATTNCSTPAVVVQSSGLTTGAVFPVGTSTVSFSASNGCSNTATCSFSVVVNPQTGGGSLSIGDFIFQDSNGNGIQDSGEPGIEYASVNLYNAANQWAGWAGTDANGQYTFNTTNTSNLVPGSYKICVAAPWNLPYATQKDAGNNDDADSDLNPVVAGSACSDLFTVAAGENKTNIDAGFSATLGPLPCAITATVGNIVCNNNNTDSDASDDTYTFTLTVNSNGVCTDGWTGEGKSGVYGTAVSFGPYLISGGNKTISVSSSTGQTTSVVAVAPSTCSNATPCSLFATASAPTCNDAGTPNASADDTYTFTLTVNATGACTGGWSGDGTTGSYGFPKTMGPYLIADGNKTITVTSTSGQTASVSVTAPATCSSPVGNTACDAVQVTLSDGLITIEGAVAPHKIIKIFNPSWQTEFECIDGTCLSTIEVPVVASGTYYIEITLMNANWTQICRTFNPYQVVGASQPLVIEDPVFLKLLNVYPNPTFYEIHVDLISPRNQEANIQYFNAQGAKVDDFNTTLSEGRNSIHNDVSDWTNGTYYFIITDDQGIMSYGRFVKLY